MRVCDREPVLCVTENQCVGKNQWWERENECERERGGKDEYVRERTREKERGNE